MAVPVVAIELCVGRPAGGRAATALSNLSAVARWLGWLLAVAAGAVAGRTDLDSAGSVFDLSAVARAAAGPGAGQATRRRRRDRARAGYQSDEQAGAEADLRATRCAAHHTALVVGTFSRTVADVAGPVLRAGRGAGRHRGQRQRWSRP